VATFTDASEPLIWVSITLILSLFLKRHCAAFGRGRVNFLHHS